MRSPDLQTYVDNPLSLITLLQDVPQSEYVPTFSSPYPESCLLQSWSKLVETNEYHTLFTSHLTNERVETFLSPSAQCCFMGLPIHPASI